MDEFGNKLFLVLSSFLSCFLMTVPWLKSCMVDFGELQYCTQSETNADMTVAVMDCHQGINPNAHHQKVATMQMVSEDASPMENLCLISLSRHMHPRMCY